jgi:hypothetical protein
MPISINTKELKGLLENTPASHNIMLSGRHGTGKSRIITEFFTGRGERVVTLFLGQMSDPGDLIGLPVRDEATGKTVFAPPYWFPTDGVPVVLFLDELNRARPEMLQTVMDLCLNRRLAGRELPPGSRIVSAVNDGEEYLLTEMDPALVSRFNIYSFRPTVGEWLLWAERSGIDPRVTAFIGENGRMLDGDGSAAESSSPLEKTPDRRGWERVSDILKCSRKITATTRKAVSGIVGAGASAAFFASLGQGTVISAESVLCDFDGRKAVLEGYPVHNLTVVNESLFRSLENGKQGPDGRAAENLLKYVGWLSESGRREAMAHFCSVFEGGAYPKADDFLADRAPDCLRIITDFIKTI